MKMASNGNLRRDHKGNRQSKDNLLARNSLWENSEPIKLDKAAISHPLSKPWDRIFCWAAAMLVIPTPQETCSKLVPKDKTCPSPRSTKSLPSWEKASLYLTVRRLKRCKELIWLSICHRWARLTIQQNQTSDTVSGTMKTTSTILAMRSSNLTTMSLYSPRRSSTLNQTSPFHLATIMLRDPVRSNKSRNQVPQKTAQTNLWTLTATSMRSQGRPS